MTDIATRTQDILDRLGAGNPFVADGDLVCRSPIDGGEIGRLRSHTADEAAEVIGRAQSAFEQWRSVPAPVRGQFVRELGELLREHKDDLGALVSIEAGKIVSEGLGEVQEMIDICDLAVGLSRQLHGLTIATERPGSPDDGAVAPAGCRRRHLGVQLPGRGVVVERRAGVRLRRRGRVEAVGEDAADRAGLPGAGRRGRSPRRCARGPVGGAARRLPDRRGAGRRPARAAGLGDRLDPHGQAGRAPCRGPPRTYAAGARRQQRRDRRAVGRSRPRGARHRVLRGRHRRSALHVAAPHHRARVDQGRPRRPAQGGLRDAADRLAARGRRRWSARWSTSPRSMRSAPRSSRRTADGGDLVTGGTRGRRRR